MAIAMNMWFILIKRSSLDEKYPGGDRAFRLKNRYDYFLSKIKDLSQEEIIELEKCLSYYCYDEYLVGIGAMGPEFGGILKELRGYGFNENDILSDNRCNWIETAYDEKHGQYMYLKGTDPGEVVYDFEDYERRQEIAKKADMEIW